MKEKIAILPKLKVSKGVWFVYFSIRDAKTDKMKPIKIYTGFNNFKTKKDKEKYGKELIELYTDKLKAGWSPLFDEKNFVYSDQLEYRNLAKHFNLTKKANKNIRFYLNEYLNRKKVGLANKTYQTYVSKLRIFCNWLDFKGLALYDISEVKNKIIIDFFDFLIYEKKLDKVTCGKYKQILVDYFNYLVKNKAITENPVFDIVMPIKTKDMAARPISKNDFKALITLIRENDPQLYLACMFQYYLAIRPGRELRFLKIKDIDLTGKTVIVTDETAKTVRRTIDMSDDLIEILNMYNIEFYNRNYYLFGREKTPGLEPLGQNTLRTRFNKYRDKLELPDIYKFYSMKHTGGGALLDNGFTIEEIKSHFGHTSIETTDNYLKRHFGNRNKKIINNFPKPY